MKLTFYGQSCFQIETAGKHLVFDPFITPNDPAKHIKIDRVKPDYISISQLRVDNLVRCTETDHIKVNANTEGGLNLYLSKLDESIEH